MGVKPSVRAPNDMMSTNNRESLRSSSAVFCEGDMPIVTLSMSPLEVAGLLDTRTVLNCQTTYVTSLPGGGQLRVKEVEMRGAGNLSEVLIGASPRQCGRRQSCGDCMLAGARVCGSYKAGVAHACDKVCGVHVVGRDVDAPMQLRIVEGRATVQLVRPTVLTTGLESYLSAFETSYERFTSGFYHAKPVKWWMSFASSFSRPTGPNDCSKHLFAVGSTCYETLAGGDVRTVKQIVELDSAHPGERSHLVNVSFFGLMMHVEPVVKGCEDIAVHTSHIFAALNIATHGFVNVCLADGDEFAREAYRSTRIVVFDACDIAEDVADAVNDLTIVLNDVVHPIEAVEAAYPELVNYNPERSLDIIDDAGFIVEEIASLTVTGFRDLGDALAGLFIGGVDGYCHVCLARPGTIAEQDLIALGRYPSSYAVASVVLTAIPSDLQDSVCVSIRGNLVHVQYVMSEAIVQTIIARENFYTWFQALKDKFVGGQMLSALYPDGPCMTRPGKCYITMFKRSCHIVDYGFDPHFTTLFGCQTRVDLEAGRVKNTIRLSLGDHFGHVCANHEIGAHVRTFKTIDLCALAACETAFILDSNGGELWYHEVNITVGRLNDEYTTREVIFCALFTILAHIIPWVVHGWRRFVKPSALTFRFVSFGSYGDVIPMRYYENLLRGEGHVVHFHQVLTTEEGRGVLRDMESGRILSRVGTYARGLTAVTQAQNASETDIVLTNVIGSGGSSRVVLVDYVPPAHMIGLFKLGIEGVVGYIIDLCATFITVVADPDIRIGSFPGYAPRSSNGLKLIKRVANTGEFEHMVATGSSSVQEPSDLPLESTVSTNPSSRYRYINDTNHERLFRRARFHHGHLGAGTAAQAVACGCTLVPLSDMIDRNYLGQPSMVFEQVHTYFWVGLLYKVPCVCWPSLLTTARNVDGVYVAFKALFIALWRRLYVVTPLLCSLVWFHRSLTKNFVFDHYSLAIAFLFPVTMSAFMFALLHTVVKNVYIFTVRKVGYSEVKMVCLTAFMILTKVGRSPVFWINMAQSGPVFAAFAAYAVRVYFDDYHLSVMGAILRLVAYFTRHNRTDRRMVWARFTNIGNGFLGLKFHLDLYNPDTQEVIGCMVGGDSNVVVYRHHQIVIEGQHLCTEIPIEMFDELYQTMLEYDGLRYTPTIQCQTVALFAMMRHAEMTSLVHLFIAASATTVTMAMYVFGSFVACVVFFVAVFCPSYVAYMTFRSSVFTSAGGDVRMGIFDLLIYLFTPVIGEKSARVVSENARAGLLSLKEPEMVFFETAYHQESFDPPLYYTGDDFVVCPTDYAHTGHSVTLISKYGQNEGYDAFRSARASFRDVVSVGVDVGTGQGYTSIADCHPVQILLHDTTQKWVASAIGFEIGIQCYEYALKCGYTDGLVCFRKDNWGAYLPEIVVCTGLSGPTRDFLIPSNTSLCMPVSANVTSLAVTNLKDTTTSLTGNVTTSDILRLKVVETVAPQAKFSLVRILGRILFMKDGIDFDLTKDAETVYAVWKNSCSSMDSFVIEARKNFKGFCNKLASAVEQVQVELVDISSAERMLSFMLAAERVLMAFEGPSRRLKSVWFPTVPIPKARDRNELGLMLGDASFHDDNFHDVWRKYLASLQDFTTSRVEKLEFNAYVRRVNRNPYIDTYLSEAKYRLPDAVINDGADGVLFATKQTMLASLARYSAAQTVYPFVDSRADEIASAIIRMNPELYDDAKLADPAKLAKHYLSHPKYSAGLPFAGARVGKKTIKTRIDLKRSGYLDILVKSVKDQIRTGYWGPTVFGSFPKSQIVSKSKLVSNPSALRSIIAEVLGTMLKSWVFTFEINKRRHWAEGPGKVGMPMNGACMSKVFADLESKRYLYQADLTKADSSYQTTVFQVLTRLRAHGFKDHPQSEVINKHLEAMYESSQKGFIVNLVAEEVSAVRLASDPVFASNLRLVDEEGWQFVDNAVQNLDVYEHPLFPGGVVRKNKGATQGGANTTWDNCEALKIVLLDTISTVHSIPVDQLFSKMVLSNVGDDNVFGVDFEVNVEGVKTHMYQRHGVTVKLSKADSIYDLDFLSKTVKPGCDFVDDFKLAGCGPKKYAVLHKAETMLMRYSNLKQESSRRLKKSSESASTYMLERILGYVSLTAHRPEVYELFRVDWEHFKNLVSPATRAKPWFVKKFVFPTYKTVLQRWYKGGFEDVDTFSKLQMHYNWVAHTHYELMSVLDSIKHTIDMLPSDLFSIEVPVTHAVTSAFETKTFIVERHIYLQFMKNNDGQSLTRSELSTEIGYTPYGGLCHPVEFMTEIAPFLPTVGVELEDAIEEARNRAFLLCLVYYQVTTILGLANYFKVTQLALALFNLYTISLPKLYSLMGSTYWLAYGRPSSAISNMIPRDIYYNHKAFSLWLISFTKPTVERVVRINWLLGICADASERVAKILSLTAGTGSPASFAKPTDNPWAAFKLEILERLSVCGSLLVKAGTGTGKTFWLPQLLLGEEIKFKGEPYQITSIQIITTRRMHCEQLGLPDVQYVKKGSSYDSTVSRFAVMTYGFVDKKIESGCADMFPDGCLLQFDEFHEEPPESVSVISILRNRYPCIYTSATPGSTFIVTPPETFVVPIAPKFVVSRIKAMGYSAVDAFVRYVKEFGKPKRVIIFAPIVKECYAIADQLRSINLKAKVVCTQDREIPDDWNTIIVATSLMESAVTVPGTDLVIDTGHRFASHRGALVDVFCDPATSEQRAGRTGRTNDGVFVQLEEVVDFRIEVYPDCGSYVTEPEKFARYSVKEEIQRNFTVVASRRVIGSEFAIFERAVGSDRKVNESLSFMVYLRLVSKSPNEADLRYVKATAGRPDEEDEYWLETNAKLNQLIPLSDVLSAWKFHEPHYLSTSGSKEHTIRMVDGRLTAKAVRPTLPQGVKYKKTLASPVWIIDNRGNLPLTKAKELDAGKDQNPGMEPAKARAP